MEPNISTRIDFMQRYWNYYLLLEKDFLATERYVAIDTLNFNSFSNEYIKQYQAVCSEIDVIAKSFCKELDSSFTGKSINSYCKCIVDNNTDFSSRIIKVKQRNLTVKPWDGWTYSFQQHNGKQIINADNPDWWQKYNKIKHKRTTINNATGLPYFKLANQKNIINSLAALFQLEMYYYRLLRQNRFPNEPDMPGPASSIFEIENWGNLWVMSGSDIGFRKTNL